MERKGRAAAAAFFIVLVLIFLPICLHAEQLEQNIWLCGQPGLWNQTVLWNQKEGAGQMEPGWVRGDMSDNESAGDAEGAWKSRPAVYHSGLSAVRMPPCLSILIGIAAAFALAAYGTGWPVQCIPPALPRRKRFLCELSVLLEADGKK